MTSAGCPPPKQKSWLRRWSRPHHMRLLCRACPKTPWPRSYYHKSRAWKHRQCGDGNCCPRSASLLFTGSDDRHTEMRVRIVRELLLHDDRYLDSSFLCQGIDRVDTTRPAVYAQYSPGYVPGSKLSDADIRSRPPRCLLRHMAAARAGIRRQPAHTIDIPGYRAAEG